MTRMMYLFPLIILAVNSANATELRFIEFKIDENEHIWTYAVTCPESLDSITVHLEIPNSAYVRLTPRVEKVSPIPGHIVKQKRIGQDSLRVMFVNVDAGNRWIYFDVKAPKSETQNGEITWTLMRNSGNEDVRVPGPVPKDVPFVRPAIMIGGSWSLCGKDFSFQDNGVSIKYDGIFLPSLGAGIILDLKCRCFQDKGIGLLLALEFGVDSDRLIDGVVTGLSFPVSRYAELTLGVSMRTDRKLRDRFKTAARKLKADLNSVGIVTVSTQGTKDYEINSMAFDQDFRRFRSLEKPEDYDGFPTIDPRDGTPFFYGTPLIDYINWVFVCGISVPIDVGELMDVIRKIPPS